MQIIIGKILICIGAILIGFVGLIWIDKNYKDTTKSFEDLCALLMIFLSITIISIIIFS